MQVMRTLYVTEHAARLRIRKRNLVVQLGRDSRRVPIETLDAVVLTGRADLTNEAIGELVARGIRISALSTTGRLRFSVGGPTKGNVLLRVAQHRAAENAAARRELARWFVAGKLQNCHRAVARWSAARSGVERWKMEREADAIKDRLAALAFAHDEDTIRGVEGDGTRRYFRVMALHLGQSNPEILFERRSRRPPRDVTNALLSFTYGLVLAEVIGALDAVGLDPQIGYLHRPRPGRPSLALDVLEEFRVALADRFVVAALGRRQLGPSDAELRAGQAVYLTEDGRRRLLRLYDQFRQQEIEHPLLRSAVPIALLPTIQATLLARHLRGDLPAYPPFVGVR